MFDKDSRQNTQRFQYPIYIEHYVVGNKKTPSLLSKNGKRSLNQKEGEELVRKFGKNISSEIYEVTNAKPMERVPVENY